MKNDTPDKTDSVVSRNIVVEGEISGAENLTINGSVKGKLHLDGKVYIGETGVVEADIEAKSVIIKGRVTGDVTAQNELELHPSGQLLGKIRARLINIKEGAVFEGRSQMIRSPAAEPKTQPKPAPSPASTNDSALSGKPGVVSG